MKKIEIEKIIKMFSINLNLYQYFELEKLSWKAYAPVKSFMNKKDFQSVVNDMHLMSGKFFPIPIFLDVDTKTKNSLKFKNKVNLLYENKIVGTLLISDIYEVNKMRSAKNIFGTDSTEHPGVKIFLNSEKWFIGGKVSLIDSFSFNEEIKELKPSDTKQIFKKKKWKTIVGFQTRNIPHRAHEYLHRVALEHVDAIFINPLVGWKKKGDYTIQAISTGYSKYVNNLINSENVFLNLIKMNMRYAGPRESLFHAIVRKNYGCTHFIIGRDHAGVGNFYQKYEAHEIAEKYKKKLGIKIMKLYGPFYCKICNGIATEKTCNHFKKDPKNIIEISGTKIRELIIKKEKVDDRFIRKEVVNSLKDIQVFIE